MGAARGLCRGLAPTQGCRMGRTLLYFGSLVRSHAEYLILLPVDIERSVVHVIDLVGTVEAHCDDGTSAPGLNQLHEHVRN